MSKKINIIQFLPYFPPHKWWLETVAEELSSFYVQKWYWNIINVIFDVWQDYNNQKTEYILNKNNIKIWYKQKGYAVYLLPSFDIIQNFPVPKFWKKDFWKILKEVSLKIINDKANENVIIQTHTRFFLSSFLGGLFAKHHKLKWVHIEHWSDYVKLGSNFKTKISYIYDRIIGKWIFKKADRIIAISEACKVFIQKEFVNREVYVIYRWLDIKINKNIEVENLKHKFPDIIIIWFVWRILKWKNVDSLIKAYYSLNNDKKNKIQIVVVWDWEELKNLKNLDKNNKIYFTWSKTFDEAILLQSQFDIHFHTSSPWGWLATTLLQAMQLWCLIIATPNEWANEIIENWKNGILLKDDKVKTFKSWIIEALENIDKKEEFSKINKDIVKEKFQRNENIEKYYNLYKSL